MKDVSARTDSRFVQGTQEISVEGDLKDEVSV